MRATVCLPTYNERENVERMVRTLHPLGVHVLVIDDNSPDGTGEIADRLARELDSVSVSLRDIVAAVCGSLVVLLALWAWRRFRPRSSTGAMVRPRGT